MSRTVLRSWGDFLKNIFIEIWWIHSDSDVHQSDSYTMGFPDGPEGKVSVHNTGDPGSIPGLGRSPGEGNGYLLQDSCLGKPMDKESRWAKGHGAARESDITQ